jgi:hypothetical protein
MISTAPATTIEAESANDNGCVTGPGTAQPVTGSGGQNGTLLKNLWSALAKLATRPDEEEPEPPRRRQKDGTDSGSFRMAAQTIMQRVRGITTDAADTITGAFSKARVAVAARLERIFDEIEAEPYDALDPANPYWEFSLEADSSSGFDAEYDDSGAASLHL